MLVVTPVAPVIAVPVVAVDGMICRYVHVCSYLYSSTICNTYRYERVFLVLFATYFLLSLLKDLLTENIPRLESI